MTIDIENGQLEINIIMISDPMRAVAREDIVSSVDNDSVVIYPDDTDHDTEIAHHPA